MVPAGWETRTAQSSSRLTRPVQALHSPYASGVLRLSLEGHWSVASFGELLDELEIAYGAARLLSLLGDSRHENLQVLLGGNTIDVAEVERLMPNLALHAIHYGSAGWVEVLGSLNPLKVISDFISQYRAEKTARKELDLREVQESHRHEEEMVREKNRHEEALLDRLTPEHRDGYGRGSLNQLSKSARAIAENQQVPDVTVRKAA